MLWFLNELGLLSQEWSRFCLLRRRLCQNPISEILKVVLRSEYECVAVDVLPLELVFQIPAERRPVLFIKLLVERADLVSQRRPAHLHGFDQVIPVTLRNNVGHRQLVIFNFELGALHHVRRRVVLGKRSVRVGCLLVVLIVHPAVLGGLRPHHVHADDLVRFQGQLVHVCALNLVLLIAGDVLAAVEQEGVVVDPVVVVGGVLIILLNDDGVVLFHGRQLLLLGIAGFERLIAQELAHERLEFN